MMNYINKKYGIQISIPKDWEVIEDFMSSVAIFLSPLDSIADKFRDNVNIIVQDLTNTPLSIEEYTELSLTQLNQVISNFDIIMEPAESMLNGRRAIQITYSGTQGAFALHYMQIWTIINNIAYVITYTAESEVFWDKLKLFEEILATFRSRPAKIRKWS